MKKQSPKKKNKKLIIAVAAVLGLIVLGAAMHTMIFGRAARLGSGRDIGFELPAPIVDGGILETINRRASTKAFDRNREIDEQMLSEILWAAWGTNERGTRTIPTAGNRQNMEVFAIMEHGTFRYDGVNNRLIPVTDKDLRPLFATQVFVMDAPLTLLFTSTDANNGALHAGSSYQNVALYCVERGCGAVVRAWFNKGVVADALEIDEEHIMTSMTVGWPES